MFSKVFQLCILGAVSILAVACSSDKSKGTAPAELSLTGVWQTECMVLATLTAEPESVRVFYKYEANNSFTKRLAAYGSTDCAGAPVIVFPMESGTFVFEKKALSDISGAYELDFSWIDDGRTVDPTRNYYSAVKFTSSTELEMPLWAIQGGETDGSTPETRDKDFENGLSLIKVSELPDIVMPLE